MTDISAWLDEVEARAAKATEPPWETGEVWGVGGLRTDVKSIPAISCRTYFSSEDADHISASRTDIPLLVRRLRVAVEALDEIESVSNDGGYQIAVDAKKRIEEEQ